MKALLVCATFGRIPYLPTMLAGFLNQKYDDKHLVIINDDTNIQLCCDVKDVTVINCNRRMVLSEKRNLGIASGYHDIIFPYDDDDVFLPDRLQHHMDKYTDIEVNAFRNTSTYVTYGGKFIRGGGPPNDISFRKSEWFNVGGYTTQGMTAEDTEIYHKLSKKYIIEDHNTSDFIYGWSGVNYHLSCSPTLNSMNENAYTQLKDMGLVGGKYWIEPNNDEYSKYLTLQRLYLEKQEELPINHVSPGIIDISHLAEC